MFDSRQIPATPFCNDIFSKAYLRMDALSICHFEISFVLFPSSFFKRIPACITYQHRNDNTLFQNLTFRSHLHILFAPSLQALPKQIVIIVYTTAHSNFMFSMIPDYTNLCFIFWNKISNSVLSCQYCRLYSLLTRNPFFSNNAPSLTPSPLPVSYSPPSPPVSMAARQ